MSSINSIINSKFITALGNSSSTDLATTLKNALNGNSASEDPVKTSLRQGAQAYATGIQGLNTLISYVNLSKASLDDLEKITDKMIALADDAKKGSTSSQARKNLDERYKRLTNQFQEIVSGAEIEGNNYLSTEGLASLFTIFGLDRENSEGIGKLFRDFKVPAGDDFLASEEKQGSRPRIPDEAYTTPVEVSRQSTDYDSIFDSDRHITKRPEAYRVSEDLQALKRQIEKNRKVLDDATQVIADNITLVRGAGFAFLDTSNLSNITDAEKAAQVVQKKIRENAPGALAQAENLQSIAVAMLLLQEKLSDS